MIKCPESFQNRIWDLRSIQEVVIVTMLQKPLPRRLGNWKPTVGKKRCQFGKSSTPTYYMSTTSPATCFSRSYPSQPVLFRARTSKEEWSPTIHPHLCLQAVAAEANPRRPYKDRGRLWRRGANIRPTSQK